MEILISMLLMAVMFTGLAALQIGTIRNVMDSERYTGATRLAESILERYQVNSYTALPTASSPPTWEVESKPDGQEARDVSVNGVDPGPFTAHRLVEDLSGGRRLITVKITWLHTSASTGPSGATYRTSSVMMSIQRAQ